MLWINIYKVVHYFEGGPFKFVLQRLDAGNSRSIMGKDNVLLDVGS